MKLSKKIIGVFLVLLIAVSAVGITATAEQAEADIVSTEPLKILFLGNSLTYKNEMDSVVFPLLAKSAGKNVDVTSVTESGTTLYRLASTSTDIGKKAHQALSEKIYDYIVIQPSRRVTPYEYSVYSAEKKAALYFNEAANEMGAETIILATPGITSGTLAIYDMNESGIGSTDVGSIEITRETHKLFFRNLCNDFCASMTNATVSYIGDAVENSITADDSVALYVSDGRHPSAAGSYLYANCIFNTIFGEDTIGNAYKGGVVYGKNALLLQRISAISILGFNEKILNEENSNRSITSCALSTAKTVKLSWNNDISNLGYEIFRKEKGSSFQLIATLPSTAVSYTDATVPTVNTYYYKIRALHKVGNLEFHSEYSPQVSVNTLGDATLKSVTLKSKRKSVITLNTAHGATSYKIYRRASTSNEWTRIGSTTTDTYTDKTMKLGKTYYYRVRACQTKNGKNVFSEYTSSKSVSALAAPTVKFTPAKKQIKLSVGKVTGATGYLVYVKASNSSSYKLVKTTSKTSFKIKGLVSGSVYRIRVRAYTEAATGKNKSRYLKTYIVRTK